MIKFMIGYRTSKLKGTQYLAIWLEDDEGVTRKIITFDKTTVLDVAILYGLSEKQLKECYCLGDSISDF